MAKRILMCVAAVLTLAIFLPSCGGGLSGFIYTDLRANNYFDSGAVTNAGGKVVTGQACAQSYVGMYAGGDASVAQALADAGVDNTKPLKNIVVDHKLFSILGLYVEYCTVVTATVEGGGGGGGYSAPAPAPEPEPADDMAAEDDSGF